MLNYQSWNEQGLSYERRVQEWFSNEYGTEFRADLWFHFHTPERSGWLKPDGLLRLPGAKCALLEIKLHTSARMWWQLRHIYGPIVRCWLQSLPGPLLQLCDLGVVRSYALPISECPEQPYVIDDAARVRPQGFWLMRLKWGELPAAEAVVA